MTGRHLTSTSGTRGHLSGGIARTLLCAAVAVVLIASRAWAGHLKVDDDGVQCPTAGFATIQAAVSAAAPGDTITVCPGTYGGQVVIDKPLRIKGKAPKVKTCNTLAPPDPTLHSILDAPAVTGVAGIGVDVFADDVTLQNLVITHAGETGIRTDSAYGAFTLKNAVLVENANGIYLHSSGTIATTVKSNCFRRNTEAGVRTRYGLVNASVSKNIFFETTNAAAIIVDHEPGTTTEGLLVTRNQSKGDSTFAVVVGTKDTVVSKNTVDATAGTAIFVGGDNVDLTIASNRVTNAGTRGIRFNTAAFGGGANTGVLVSKNIVDKAGIHGIAVDSSAGESTLVASTIEKNVVSNSGQTGAGDGIRVEDPDGIGRERRQHDTREHDFGQLQPRLPRCDVGQRHGRDREHLVEGHRDHAERREPLLLGGGQRGSRLIRPTRDSTHSKGGVHTMRHFSALSLSVGLLLSAGLATAGTQVKGTIVPHDASSNPLLSFKSSFGMKGTGAFSVSLKGMTDSAGSPAPVTTGTTPDAQYWLTVKGDAQGILWQYNVPISITKAGQAKLKGSVALISAVPAGSAIGVLGVEVHEPTPAGSAADCQTVMTDPTLPGVFVPGVSPFASNPCATGARLGLTGLVTGQ